ncbi:response regulator transcription factor [Luteolibacter marinus]|uniref:response regulator transcription factor n=1 Tax=Luteolibacter marinus TaxID=2776705 RepID=UPI0018669D9A|nr:helix-turn-helix transcriptional regulator [Luteolibacter marinus]
MNPLTAPQPESLPLEDVGRIVRLLGEIAVAGGTMAEKRTSLLQGLARLIDSDAWIWGVSQHSESGRQPEYACIVRGGFSDEQFTSALQANEHPDMQRLCAPIFADFAADKRPLTRRREQIIPDAVYDASEVASIWKEAGVGPVILSFHPLNHGGASAVALYRRFGRPAFSPRESRIAHVVLLEVPWLHFDIPGIDTPPLRMGPRLRQVLNLLIQGASRKEIASHLGISIHTVSGYCKELYAKFKVNSHAELVSRFSHGDGGDRAQENGGTGSVG